MSGPTLWTAVLTGACFSIPSFAAGPSDLANVGRERVIRVLVLTGGHAFDHTEFFQMFDGQPDLAWTEARLPDAVAEFAPEKAANYDVMVWYGFGQKTPDEQTRRNILGLLEAGKPLLVVHHAISIFPEWPEAERIIGGRYVLKPEAGHPGSTFKHDQKVPVRIADKSHPVTRFMEDFDMVEETYDRVPVAAGVRPLITTDRPESMPVLGWTHTFGRSTVEYLQPGHGPTAFRNPGYRRLFLQSIRWLAGGLPAPTDEGFTPLFNGKNFDGWQIMGKPEGFWIKDGAIRSESHKGGDWMRTEKPYENFILRVQWRVGMGGNSGIFVRSQEEGYPWVSGTEIQITNEYRDPPHCTGSLYGMAAVNPRPDERADVWHETEIQCDGCRMKVFCDNIPVVDVDARQVPGLAGRPLRGFIGLQDSHNRDTYIEFRKVLVKELPMSKGGASLWRVGTQAYTFHKYTLFEAIDKARALGLNFIELFPGQAISPDRPDTRFDHNSSKELRAEVKRKLEQSGVTAVSYGVVSFKPQEAAGVFAFALDMGISTIVAEPDDTPEMWKLLDRLTEEFNIRLAIHNHPRPSPYWDPRTVLKAVKGLNPRIGACADTGHWLRSGISPMEAIRMLEGRIIELHFKDLNEASMQGHDVPWGTGKADARALLAELNRQGFAGLFSIEYEHNWLNSMPEIAECLKFFHQVTRELSAAPR